MLLRFQTHLSHKNTNAPFTQKTKNDTWPVFSSLFRRGLFSLCVPLETWKEEAHEPQGTRQGLNVASWCLCFKRSPKEANHGGSTKKNHLRINPKPIFVGGESPKKKENTFQSNPPNEMPTKPEKKKKRKKTRGLAFSNAPLSSLLIHVPAEGQVVDGGVLHDALLASTRFWGHRGPEDLVGNLE